MDWTKQKHIEEQGARDKREQRRYVAASRVMAAIAPMPQGTWAEKARDAVTAAGALLAALEAGR